MCLLTACVGVFVTSEKLLSGWSIPAMYESAEVVPLADACVSRFYRHVHAH
jgi:hypothetical protein